MFAVSLSLVLATFASSVSANCVHGTSFFPRAEGKVEVSKFGYTGLQGPLNWAALDSANSACRMSKVQSPIVIDDSVPKAKSAPKVVVENVEEAEFENLGTTLEVVVSGTTTYEGIEFGLKQFHIHTPSEHRIKDEYFPLEIHMVHQAADESIAVIAIPFQLTEDGSTTELLTSVVENLSKVTEPGTSTTTGPLDFGPLIQAIETRPLFQYSGSLTTPPCKEGLTFLVMEEPLALNVKTYNALKAVIKFNARYSQNKLGDVNLLTVANEHAKFQDGCTQSTPGSKMEMVSMEKVVNHCTGMCKDKSLHRW
ncbi:alpha carbonic anhydrase [Mycena albidolilacea]|uniref:Carbonic anhydrase n=1 Tax=Mycena albidolilacea TaxID=1033008 RepID=A0AAD7F3G3_9AGAR|nr:alpha carbonic anhydrase [Mycena albidolilacea]